MIAQPRSRVPQREPRSRAHRAHRRQPPRVAQRQRPLATPVAPLKASRPQAQARAPMPPIWMPIELKFANPQRANVAMVKDFGSRVAFSGPSCE